LVAAEQESNKRLDSNKQITRLLKLTITIRARAGNRAGHLFLEAASISEGRSEMEARACRWLTAFPVFALYLQGRSHLKQNGLRQDAVEVAVASPLRRRSQTTSSAL
jgi:hypothetical protein